MYNLNQKDMKKIIATACALICALAVSEALMAEVNTYTVKVGEFNKLKVLDNIETEYVCNPDSAGYVSYECEDRLADVFLFTNKGGTLKLQVHTEYAHLTESLPKVRVYSTYLTYAENQSIYNMTLRDVPPGPEFSVKLVGNGSITADDIKATKVKARIETGNGTISISGDCDFATFTMAGTGKILADELMADDVTCKVFGTGSIGCWPVDKLHVKGLGSTTVYYKGSPREIKQTGIAKIEKMP